MLDMKRHWLLLLLGLGLLACTLSVVTADDDKGWRLLDVRTTGPCVESAMAWDATRKVFVLHGGRNRRWDDLGETWEWSPGDAEWSRVVDAARPNPGKRRSHAMVWDSARERMLLFGGSNEGPLNDTWAYDAKSTGWVPLQTTGNPPARTQHGMVYDPVRDEILLFGGRDSMIQPLSDTWSLDLNTLRWSLLSPPKDAPQPQARDHVQMARDPLSGLTVMRVHSLGEGLPDETWHFDAEVRGWRLLETQQQPQGMDHGLLCAVEGAGGLLLIGVHDDSLQTWLHEPRIGVWTQLDAVGQPPDNPIDHGQAGSDGPRLYFLGGFGGADVPPDAGLTPRGAMWMYSADKGPKH